MSRVAPPAAPAWSQRSPLDLAAAARRPVRVVLSREEVFYTITKHAAVIRMKTGVKKDGTLVARECEIHLDTGAYAEIGPRVAKKSGYTAAGP